MGIIISQNDLKRVRNEARNLQQTIVWTNVCFDILHAGHVKALREAKKYGDVLVVGLNSDASVRLLKGNERPFMNEEHRAELLAALEMVDYVVIFDNIRCDSELMLLQPDVWAKSGDYTRETLDVHELNAVESNGGRVHFLHFVHGLSTSNVAKRIRRMDPEKIISGSYAFLQNERDELLLVANRYEDGVVWGLPGGGQLRGESLIDTLKRECMEEACIEIEIIRYAGLIERIDETINRHLLAHQFIVKNVKGTPKPSMCDEQVFKVGYFSAEEIRAIPERIFGRQYILQFMADPNSYPTYIQMGIGEE